MQVFLMVKQLTSYSHMSAHILRRYPRAHTATQKEEERERNKKRIWFSALPLLKKVFLIFLWIKSFGLERKIFEWIQLCFFLIVWTPLWTTYLTKIIKSLHSPPVVLPLKIIVDPFLGCRAIVHWESLFL